MIEGKSAAEIQKMISKRETLLNVSAIFHVIIGSRLLSSKDPRFSYLQEIHRKNLRCKNEHMKIFIKLLSLDCDVNVCDFAGFTPLQHCCTAFGTEETMKMAELLLKKGADINAKNRFGSTALQEQK